MKPYAKAIAMGLRTIGLSFKQIAEYVQTSESTATRWFRTNESKVAGKAAMRHGKYAITESVKSDLLDRYSEFTDLPTVLVDGLYFIGRVVITGDKDKIAAVVTEIRDNAVMGVFKGSSGIITEIVLATRKRTEKKKVGVVATKSSITVVKDGKAKTAVKGTPSFVGASRLLKNGDAESAFELIGGITSNGHLMAKFTEGRVQIAGDDVFIDGVKMHNAVAKKIIDSFNSGEIDVARKFSMFVQRLTQNPDPRVVDSIYAFISANDIQLDPDGFVIAFKKVRGDYFDIHSGTMDNSPGRIVYMDRKDVDDDPKRTCSRGLHVCSRSYLRHFGHSDSRTVRCLVCPSDFVSIPADYNDAKARVCEYFVLDELDA